MLQLFHDSAYRTAGGITNLYSTSFSRGISLLAKKFRNPINGIYGFVRYADEIVDTFHEFNKQELLVEFETETWKALDRGISLNPVLHAFQMTVREYKINRELIADFFHSMKMDLTDRTYQTESFNRYIYGSAEVVGLMCLRVFIENNNELYEKLKPYATALGAAFQKVNFLRDMKDDYQTRGREYFPDFNFQQFTTEMKRRIEADIEKDFQSAARGIAMLPLSSRLGVYTAYVYYRELFSKIQSSSPAQVLDSRIRISDSQKAYLMLRSYVRHKLNWL